LLNFSIALDCEMVGLGPLGSESCLARISVVNYHGHVLLDTFVQPRETVTDWRTWISGIRASDVFGAPQFETVQKQVSELCEGRVVVGHAIENDMKALLLSHPGPMTRDTQQCKPLREKAKTKRPGLKRLAEMELGIKIQTGAHSSVSQRLELGQRRE
jgi:RNA exonuclease 4